MLDPNKVHYEPVYDDYIGDVEYLPEWTTDIDPDWNDYDKTVAKCHMNNYGRVYLSVIFDGRGMMVFPCDDECEVEERHSLEVDLANC